MRQPGEADSTGHGKDRKAIDFVVKKTESIMQPVAANFYFLAQQTKPREIIQCLIFKLFN